MIRSDLALAALASAAVPGMKPVSVTGVSPGSDQGSRYQVGVVSDATGRTWVIRVPLDPAAGAALEQNAPLVGMLGRHLPFKVPAPAGYADVGRDGRAAVYPFVDGDALNLRELPAGTGLGNALGRAIAAVHNIPAGLFEEGGVPTFDAAGVRSRKLAELDRAAETGLVPTGLLARWEQALDAESLWSFGTTCVHGRLDGDCFLVSFSDNDAATGRVVGITDWDEAKVGDPADDFAALVAQASPRAVDTVVDSYALARSQRPDPHFVHRARLAAEMALLHGLANATSTGDDDLAKQRAERLRRLDRLTAADDSLVPRTAMVTSAAQWRTAESDGANDADVADQVEAASGEDDDEPAWETSIEEVAAVRPDADEDDRADTADDSSPAGDADTDHRDDDLPDSLDDDLDDDVPGDTPDDDVTEEIPLPSTTDPEPLSVDGADQAEEEADEQERLEVLYDMPAADEMDALVEDLHAGTDTDADPADDGDSADDDGSAGVERP